MAIMIASLVAGIAFLSPADLVLLTRSASYAIFGLSNIFFWKEYGNYFSANSAEAPLLQTWSLGVEEQFYCIWPLLLLFFFRFFRQNILITLIVLFLLGTIASEVGTQMAVSASYYLLPTRFFELMIGGILTLLCKRYQPRNKIESNSAFLIGLAVLLMSLIWIDKSDSFPGLNALIPCIAAALLIWAGLLPTALSRLLTLRPMIFIGLLSYSLYLWHWPLIVYVKYFGIKINVYTGMLIFCLALFLSWLTWKFVEIPFRRSGAGMVFRHVLIERFALPAIALLVLNTWVFQTRGFPGRFSPEVVKLEAAQQAKPNELRAGCHVPTALYEMPLLDRCKLGADKFIPDGILLGDSFANHFTGMIDVIAKHDDLAFVDYTMDGCPPIAGYDSGKISAYVKRCQLRNEAAYEEIERRKYKHVIMASNWPEAIETAPLLISSIERAQRTGAHVTVIFRNEAIENGNTCAIRNAMYGRDMPCKKLPKGQPAYIKDLQVRFPNVSFIDPNTVICGPAGCDPVLDGLLIYRDSVHLNDPGSRLVGERLLAHGVSLLGSR
jgi:peptidoglycan/LPS O-acetylase OafA/YrhL